MKQLHIREPWADLAYRSGDDRLDDLLNRIQVLEARVRELESRESKDAAEAQMAASEAIPVRSREPVSVGA